MLLVRRHIFTIIHNTLTIGFILAMIFSAFGQAHPPAASAGDPDLAISNGYQNFASEASDIVINEVDPNIPDVIEFYNKGSQATDMTGWQFLAYDFNDTLTYTYTFSFTLQADAYAILVEEGDPANSTDSELFTGESIGLSGAVGAAVLQDESGNCLDFVRWGHSTVTAPSGCAWTGQNPGGLPLVQSTGRDASSTDTDDGDDWCTQEPSQGIVNNACVPPPGSITGTVTHNSSSLDNIRVDAFREHGGGWQLTKFALSDSMGDYNLTALPVGTYRVRFSDPGDIYATEYYDDAPDIFSATNITVTTGVTTTNVNAVLSSAGPLTISGYVHDRNDDPMAGVMMEGLPGSPVTAADGFYSGTVPFQWTGSVTPTLAGATFLPPARPYEDLKVHLGGQNYNSTNPSGADVLLVDDDNNLPDVRSYYTNTLNSLAVAYDIWDTVNSDAEPGVATLNDYPVVIWFTGAENSGYAGPGTLGEGALGTWLDGGGCFFISSQDYLADRGQTTFMSDYLGLDTYTSDFAWYSSVSGQGTVFASLGPYTLTYPIADRADSVWPSVSAEQAFKDVNNKGAAINKDGTYRSTFWAFPFEALETGANRAESMTTFLNWCGESPPSQPPIINHEPVTLAEAGIALPITATVTSQGPPLTVTLHYSSTTTEIYLDLPMIDLGGNVYTGTIPAMAVVPPTLSYFIEATDAIGTTTDGPHLVAVIPSDLRPAVWVPIIIGGD